ncbi:MAG: hypothetical protein WCJ10_07240, partial [Opitutaceae bacterium]
DHPLWLELVDWLKNGRRVTRHEGQAGNVLNRRPLIQAFAEVHNEGWIKGLFVADDSITPTLQHGNSGTAFDQVEIFTFDQAARALVFDRTGRYVPALSSRLTADGQAYHDWLDELRNAASKSGPDALQVSAFEGDTKRTLYIQRAHLRQWCEARGMRPAFLFGSNEATPESIATQANGCVNQAEICDQWKRGLKLVALECATAIHAANKRLTGPALWDAIAADPRVKIRDSITAEYKNADPSLIGGEVSAVAKTIKTDWRRQLANLVETKSG